MVKALIELDENTNRVLNVIKARQGFRDKSEVIQFIIGKHIDDEGEPELQENFIKKILKIQNQKSVKVNNFAKRYGLK